MQKQRSVTGNYIVVIVLIGMVLLLACYMGQQLPTLINSPAADSATANSNSGSTTTPTLSPRPSPTPAPVSTAIDAPALKAASPTAIIQMLQPLEDGLPLYDFDITLHAEAHRIDVNQTVLLHNSSGDTWTEVVFQFLPAHSPDQVQIDLAQVSINAGDSGIRTFTVNATLDDMMLHVPLPVDVEPAGALEVALVYSLFVPEVNASTWMPEGNLGAGEQVIQAGDWHAALVPYKTGQGWQTWTYTPVGDPVIYELAHYQVELTAGPDWVIAAPGFVRQEGNRRIYKLDRARSFSFFASRTYQFIEGNVQDIAIKLYYLPGYEDAARDVMSTASQALWLFTEYYGDYPMPELVIVQNAYYGSMEYSGLISLSQHAFDAYDGEADSLLITLTAHEIAHQWWYGAVGNDQVNEPWLDESFAKYSEYLFYERYHPELTDWWWQVHIYGRSASGPIDRSIYDYADASVYIRQLYPRGARFLADLRADMGDKAFFEFVQTLRSFGDGRMITADAFFVLLKHYNPPNLDMLKAQYFAYLD